MKISKLLFLFFLMASVGIMVSCGDDDDPMPGGGDEDEEFIDEVVLTFTPQEAGNDVVTARWFDADGDGSGSGEVTQGIELAEGVTYDLSMTLNNTVAGENITEEIEEEAEEHQFFFEFTNDIFSDPSGNGNVDNRDDPVNYNDLDANSLPVGLSTTWTAGGHTDASGDFRIILKHQPDLKSATSDATTGGTDLDITFPIDIEHDENEEEEFIDEVILTFTPQEDGEEPVVARWFDADGDGVGSGEVTAGIELEEGVTYDLAITLANTIEGENITEEIEEEGDEHQFFFEFTNDIFSDPSGNGNVDNASDPLNYSDQDANGLPIGLSTTWTAGGHTDASGEFTVVLKHQPGQKSATSDANTGGTDINITFPIDIEEHDHNEEEEFIDEIILTFTPQEEGEEPIVARWFDADGDGVGSGMVTAGIELEEGVTYDLAITLMNTVEGEDVTEEIEEEGDEHQFFFEFTNDIFSDPTGNGNVDNASDPLNYSDQDANGLPIGLATTWTAGGHTDATGEFRVVLKHQPGQKSASSDATTGGTDIDITFPIDIEEHDHNEEEEFIDEVVLTFTPTAGGDAVVVTWADPDGEGVASGAPDGPINLTAGAEYDLTITLANTIEGEDITAEIEEEADEHQFFFEFTADIFSDPAGDGNFDNGSDPVNYNDQDANGLPVGLSTKWTAGSATTSTGAFRVILKHQPGQKSATSDATTGGTDIDIPFDININ